MISRVEKSFPKLTEIGTTLLLSIKGCLALIREIYLSSFILGVIQFKDFEYLALANIKSK